MEQKNLSLIWIRNVPPPFHKSRYALPQSTVTRSLVSFLRMTMRRPVPTKGLRRVSSARAHGHGPWQTWQGGPFVGTGRGGGIYRKQTSPIKRSYSFGTEEVVFIIPHKAILILTHTCEKSKLGFLSYGILAFFLQKHLITKDSPWF